MEIMEIADWLAEIFFSVALITLLVSMHRTSIKKRKERL